MNEYVGLALGRLVLSRAFFTPVLISLLLEETVHTFPFPSYIYLRSELHSRRPQLCLLNNILFCSLRTFGYDLDGVSSAS